MNNLYVTCALLCLQANISWQKSNSQFINLIHQTKGDVSFVGVFNDRYGNECKKRRERGLEEIISVIWTIEALNNYDYLSGITIGVSLFSLCDNFNNQTIIFDYIEKHLFKESYYIGVLTTSKMYNILSSVSKSWNKNVWYIEHVLTSKILTHAAAQLLINLQWMNVVVISDSMNLLESFRKAAHEEEIIINQELYLNGSDVLKDSNTSEVIVVFAEFFNIKNLTRNLRSDVKLILTPTDFYFEFDLKDLPRNTIVSLPCGGHKTALLIQIDEIQENKDLHITKPPVKGPLFIGSSATIVKLFRPIKNTLTNNCHMEIFYSEQTCVHKTDFTNVIQNNKSVLPSQKSMKISSDDVEETLKVLKIEPTFNDEMFLYIASVIDFNLTEDLAIFKIFNLKTKFFFPVLVKINEGALKNGKKTNFSDTKTNLYNKFSHLKKSALNLTQKFMIPTTENIQIFRESNAKKNCDLQDDHLCLNVSMNYTSKINNTSDNNSEVVWRSLTWVFINASFGFVGITCTISTMFFIITRLCKNDIPDSPYFTFVLMICVIFMYLSALPFYLECFNHEWMCIYRKYEPSIIFSFLFSLLLSRSFILAVTESEKNFVSVINGYLQCILFFFMIGIQAALIIQNYLYQKTFPNCTNMYEMIVSLGYNFLLLILLACVSPFIIRSKRNYKEGLLFSINVFFITVVWSVWISFYVLLPNEHKDAAVALGLISTASVPLFCVFIPQTFLITTALKQCRTMTSFTSFNDNFLEDVSNVNFISNRALNESSCGTSVDKTSNRNLFGPKILGNQENGSTALS